MMDKEVVLALLLNRAAGIESTLDRMLEDVRELVELASELLKESRNEQSVEKVDS